MKGENDNLSSDNSGSNPKRLNLTPEKINAFSGKKTTEQIFIDLLAEIKKLDFGDYLKLPKGAKARQKHLVVGIVKRLLEVAKENRWNLANVYDYVYIFNGCYWQQLEKDELKSLLGKAAITMGVPDYDATHFDFKDKLLKQFLTAGHVTAPKKNKDSILINLTNGTFRFSPTGGELSEFNPKDFLTNQLPFEYSPAAECPLFDKFLLKVLPDQDCRKVLQEFCGSIFCKINHEKVLMLTGSGSNGKSVFFNVLCALIGKANTLTYSIGMFNHEYKRAKLADMLINFSSEKGSDINPEILKSLASQEPQQAREPKGRSYTIYDIPRFIINANELPVITEQTYAFFRRFIIIPFETRITEEEKDVNLADKIIASELPGIFNWILQGLCRIMEQQKFTKSEKIDRAIENYKLQSDSVALFVEERLLIKSTSLKQAVADLFKDYKNFCVDDGYKPVGKNKFSTRLENKGFERTRLTGGGAAFFIETDFSRD